MEDSILTPEAVSFYQLVNLGLPLAPGFSIGLIESFSFVGSDLFWNMSVPTFIGFVQSNIYQHDIEIILAMQQLIDPGLSGVADIVTTPLIYLAPRHLSVDGPSGSFLFNLGTTYEDNVKKAASWNMYQDVTNKVVQKVGAGQLKLVLGYHDDPKHTPTSLRNQDVRDATLSKYSGASGTCVRAESFNPAGANGHWLTYSQPRVWGAFVADETL